MSGIEVSIHRLGRTSDVRFQRIKEPRVPVASQHAVSLLASSDLNSGLRRAARCREKAFSHAVANHRIWHCPLIPSCPHFSEHVSHTYEFGIRFLPQCSQPCASQYSHPSGVEYKHSGHSPKPCPNTQTLSPSPRISS